jgi:hypothetical protein
MYTTRTMVSALLPDLDQETKPSLVSIKKQNRRAHGRRPLFFIFYLLPCPALFRIFLLLPGTRGGSYIGNGQYFFSFCCQGQEEEVI